jgi:hypothetical protein
VDGGGEELLDLRFRAVGEELSLVNGSSLGGGPTPGGGTFIDTHVGSDFLTGLFLNDLFLTLRLTYENAPKYETRLYASGDNCQAALDEELARGATITGLGGDPTRDDGLCTLVGIGVPSNVLPRQYLVGVLAGEKIVDLMRTEPNVHRGYVLTAISEVDAGSYAFIAESRVQDGGVVEFETRLVVKDSKDIGLAVEELSDAGMIITASSGGPSGYTMVGTRSPGGIQRRDSITLREDGIDPARLIEEVVLQGLAPVAVMASSLPDGGFEVVTVGQR